MKVQRQADCAAVKVQKLAVPASGQALDLYNAVAVAFNLAVFVNCPVQLDFLGPGFQK
jgi:hypothetical protein